MITQQELKEKLDYNPDTGEFRKICYTRGKHFGRTLKKRNNKTISGHTVYQNITINGKSYPAHKLAWLYMTGEYPDCFIDHINRDSTDNRFSNLRKASYAENNRNKSMSRNNTSGYKGVNWHKGSNKWRAEIKVNNKAITIGYFKNIEDANIAYTEAVKQYHGQFATWSPQQKK